MLDKGLKSQKGYSSFKMRPDLDFSSSVGHIIPVLYDFLYPSDKVDVSFKLKTRTQPLDAAAFGEFKECIDTFFVPIEQLYHNFKNQIYGIFDFDSDFFAQPTSISTTYNPYFPFVTLTDLFNNVQQFDTIWYSPFFVNRFGTTPGVNKSESLRLLEALGFPIKALYSAQPVVATDTNMSVNLWYLLAYQKIFYDHYRITDRIDNDANAYNVDSLYNTSFNGLPAADQMARARLMCAMHYVPYDDDFYTKNYTSPILGSRSVGSYPSDALSKVNQWLSNISNISTVVSNSNGSYPTSDLGNPSSVSMTLSSTTGATHQTVGANINTANIRTIFASEKLLEVTRRAGKHYDKQTLAHFGINVPTGISGECSWIGHHEQELVIGEVVSTSQTEVTDPQGNALVTPLGKIAGRGFSLGNSQNVRFTAPCHGILMSVFYVKPVAKYKQLGLDRLLTNVHPSDYMTPEMDGLGLQPLFGYQTDFVGNAVAHNKILGWQFRYMESKDKPKRVIGTLAGSLDYWTFTRPAISSTTDSYYVLPMDCNNLFLLQWTGALPSSASNAFSNVYDEIYDNDNFLHSLAIGYNKASKMSVTGMTSI